MGENFLFHFFCGTADRRAGIVCIVLATEIFFTVRTKDWVKYDIFGIDEGGRGKTFCEVVVNEFSFCLKDSP